MNRGQPTRNCTFATILFTAVIDCLPQRGLFWPLVCFFIYLSGPLIAQPAPLGVNTPLNRIYQVDQLRRDFRLLRKALEEAHPGLYRYYPRDSVSRWLDAAETKLNHPMTELDFRRTVEPAIDRFGCGHTDLYASKAFVKYRRKHLLKPFPLGVLVLNEKLYVSENRSTDSTVRRGAQILAINGRPAGTLLHQFYQYISSDGYNQTFRPYVLNTGLFGTYYMLAVGADSTAQRVTLRDSTGAVRTLTFLTRPEKARIDPDSVVKKVVPASRPHRAPKPEKPDEQRTLSFSDRDSSLAVLSVKSFTGGGQRAFLRKSFQRIADRPQVTNLVIDVRGNLGGNSAVCTKLVSYLVDKPFQAYTQVDALVRQVSFNKYLGWKFWRFWLRHFFTYKTPEGTYRRTGVTRFINPTRRDHFGGRVFILTNGGTFSAASIFASLTKHNAATRVTVVGRETGGGAHSCNAFTSPYMTLPETGVQLRLPLYHIELAVPGPETGHGVIPDVPVAYTVPAILQSRDLDMERVYELLNATR